jgi:hypothetical protein
MIAVYAVSSVYGGVEVLLARFCEYLSKNDRRFILIVDKASRVAKELDWAEQITLDELKNYGEHISYLFLPSITFAIHRIPWRYLRKATIFSMILHPTSIYTAFFPGASEMLEKFGFSFARLYGNIFDKYHRLLSEFILLLLNSNSLCAMDGATLRCLRYFFPIARSCSCETLPIPISSSLFTGDYQSFSTIAKLSIGYFGRLTEFKYSALLSFVETFKLSPSLRNLSICFHIVGEGGCIEKFKDLCSRNSIDVVLYGFMCNEDGKRLLASKVDFAVAMGTAALDVASVGIPCIIIDPVHRPSTGSQQKFRFVHEIEQYTLGEYRDFPGYVQGLHSLEECISMLETTPELGRLDSNYVHAYHNPDEVFRYLYQSILSSTLSIDVFGNYAEKLLREKYSINKLLQFIKSFSLVKYLVNKFALPMSRFL